MIKTVFGKTLKLYFYFSIFVLPLVFMQRCEEAYYLPKLAILAGGVMFLPAVFASFFRRKPDLIDILAVGFLAWYTISASVSMAAVRDIVTAQRLAEWAGAISFFLYARRFVSGQEARKAAALGLISAALVCAYALLQVFKIDLKGWAVNFSGRAFSSLGNPDFLGGFIVMTAPLCLIFAKEYGRRSALLFTLLFGTLILSQTRSSLAAFGVSLILMAVLFPGFFGKNWTAIVPGVVVVAVFLMFSGNAGNLISRVAEGVSLSNTDLTGRVSMWAAGLRMIQAGVITGIGPGLISGRYCHYRQGGPYFETEHLHNDFIELFAESGLPSFLCLMAVIGLAIYAMVKKREPFQMAVLAATAGLLVQAFFNFPLYIMDTKLYFFAFLGMATAAGEGEKAGTKAPVIGLLFALLLVLSVMRMVVASCYMNHSVNAAEGSDLQGASYAASRALAIQPGAKSLSCASRADFARADWQACAKHAAAYTQFFACSKPIAINGAIAYAEMKDFQASLRFLDDFLYYYPGDTDVLNNKAKVLFLSGDITASISLYSHVLTLDPWNETAHVNLIAILKGTGKTAEAQEEEKRWKALGNDK